MNILKLLNEALKAENIDAFSYRTILEMSENVIDALAADYNKVKKGVKDIMGGQALEHEAKTIYNQGLFLGREEGFTEGRTEGFTAGRINALMDLVNIGLLSVDDAAKTAGLSKSEFEKKYKEIKNS